MGLILIPLQPHMFLTVDSQLTILQNVLYDTFISVRFLHPCSFVMEKSWLFIQLLLLRIIRCLEHIAPIWSDAPLSPFKQFWNVHLNFYFRLITISPCGPWLVVVQSSWQLLHVPREVWYLQVLSGSNLKLQHSIQIITMSGWRMTSR